MGRNLAQAGRYALASSEGLMFVLMKLTVFKLTKVQP
jgi:hypothetical protein